MMSYVGAWPITHTLLSFLHGDEPAISEPVHLRCKRDGVIVFDYKVDAARYKRATRQWIYRLDGKEYSIEGECETARKSGGRRHSRP